MTRTSPSDVSERPSIASERRSTSPRHAAWVYRACRLLLAWPLRSFFRHEVFGKEHVARSGPLLLASNHASFLDPWFIGANLPLRTVRFLMTERWYERGPIWKWLFRGGGVIPVATGRPEETVRRVVEALRAGSAVCVFPEGGISRDGRIRRGRSGIGYIAAASGVPVTPCYLEGNHEALPPHRRLPRRTPVRLHVAPPIPYPGGPTAHPDSAAVVRYVRSVMAAIGRFEPEPRPGGPQEDSR